MWFEKKRGGGGTRTSELFWSSLREFIWESKCFHHCHRNLFASVSLIQLSHKVFSEWHCHKSTELEKCVPQTAVLTRKILCIYSSPPLSPTKNTKLWGSNVTWLYPLYCFQFRYISLKIYSSQLITCFLD